MALDSVCDGCGSTETDRINAGCEDTGLKECRYCGASKCEMCDMGDDVDCMTCENLEE